ncbi:hypothetical protein ACQ4PT_008747 [Festuca glaucescens]
MARGSEVSDVDYSEVEAGNKTWGKEVEMKSDDGLSKIINIDVDMSKTTHCGLAETGGSFVATGGNSMTEKTEMPQRRASSISFHVPKVPERIRAVDGDGYTPHYVPIGPYHRNCSSPQIEEEKLLCVGYLQSLSEKHVKGGLRGVEEKLESWARLWYPDMAQAEMSRMLLHDGCYLLCCMVNYRPPTPKDDDKEGSRIDGGTVVRDTLFLVENQIPLLVLEKIHEAVTGGATSALDHLATFVHKLLHEQLYISKKARPQKRPTPHLLHLVHACFQPTIVPAMADNGCRRPRTGRWRRATEYRRHANVQFKRRDLADDVEASVLNVSFQGGTLWIPPLRVDSMTWTVLRNLMALEEHIPRRPVTAYCICMSQVACTVEDVQLLRRAGTVEHFMASDEEVAQGFADLCKGVVMDVDNPDRNYLKPIWHELEKRCDSRLHGCLGWLRQHVWLSLAFVVAVIVLACQLTQTFCAVTGCGHLAKH